MTVGLDCEEGAGEVTFSKPVPTVARVSFV